MTEFAIANVADHSDLIAEAVRWFAEKWEVSEEAYRESMAEATRGEGPWPQWYVAMDGVRIIGGCGVVENDFNDRPDLAPNLCALYVEPEARGCGVAGALLKHACADMAARGVNVLYLITDHDSFYECYGWEFVTYAHEEGGPDPVRLYRSRTAS